ncbi:MAG: tetratricopeptide repeat protein, partial [Bacteroidota bacterium]
MKKILLIFFLFNSFNCFSQSTAIEFYNEANKKAYKKNYQGAILDYSKAIQIDSNKFSAYSGRAGAYMNNGNYHDAISDFNKAIELNSNSSFDYVNRGISRYVVNDFDGAIEDLSKTIELDPTNSHAYIYLGVINLYWHEKYKEALSNYSKAISLNSEYRDSLIICGDLCYKIGDYAGAIDNYYNNIAYLSGEEKARVYLKIGYCFEKLGNLKRASRFYKESIDLKPNLSTWGDYYQYYDLDFFHINNINQYSNIHYLKSFKYVIYDVDFDLIMGIIVSIIILLFIFYYLCIIEGFFLSFRQKIKSKIV